MKHWEKEVNIYGPWHLSLEVLINSLISLIKNMSKLECKTFRILSHLPLHLNTVPYKRHTIIVISS